MYTFNHTTEFHHRFKVGDVVTWGTMSHDRRIDEIHVADGRLKYKMTTVGRHNGEDIPNGMQSSEDAAVVDREGMLVTRKYQPKFKVGDRVRYGEQCLIMNRAVRTIKSIEDDKGKPTYRWRENDSFAYAEKFDSEGGELVQTTQVKRYTAIIEAPMIEGQPHGGRLFSEAVGYMIEEHLNTVGLATYKVVSVTSEYVTKEA